MSNNPKITNITINDTTYDIEDASATAEIANINGALEQTNTNLNGLSSMAAKSVNGVHPNASGDILLTDATLPAEALDVEARNGLADLKESIGFIVLAWEQGRLSTAGKNATSSYSIRSPKAMWFDVNKVYDIKRPSGSVLYAFTYTSEGTYQENHEVKGQFTVETGKEYVRFVLRNKQSTDINVSYGKELEMSFQNTQLAHSVADAVNNNAGYVGVTWEMGRLRTSDGVELTATDTIRTVGFTEITPDTDYLVTRPDGTSLWVYRYNSNGVFQSYSRIARKTFRVTAGEQFVRFVYKSADAHDIDTSFGDDFVVSALSYKLSALYGRDRDATFDKPMLTIIDDDGDSKFFTDIFPIIQAKKAPICSAVIVGKVGNVGKMTWDNIKQAYENGAEILSHTFTHPITTDSDFEAKTAIDFREDYVKARHGLISHGIESRFMVFSGSSGNYEKCQDGCKLAGYDGAFLAGANSVNYGLSAPHEVQRYRIGSDYAWNYNTLKNIIDSDILQYESYKGWMVWMCHTSADNWISGTGEGSSAYILGQIVDYCRENGIEVVSPEYGFKKYYNI